MAQETEDQRRARVLADIEAALAEEPAAVQEPSGWQYPPAPLAEQPPEPPLSGGALAMLGAVVGVVGAAVVIAVSAALD